MESGDDDLKEFIKILFPNPERKIDSEELSYLSRLGSQGLESLKGEVARLSEELAIVEHQTRDMASQNYQIFVQSAQTTNKIKTSLYDGSQAVLGLTEETLPQLKEKVKVFSDVPCEELGSGTKGTEVLFENQATLVKILEMPWVVRRCLAEEKLPNAIKVLLVAQDMVKNVPTPPPILVKTCEEVTLLKSEIRQALLSKLSSGNIGLSECLQTVSLLRSFFPDDRSLRFRFLQSRMKEVPFEQARTWVFDTLTQHRAAFGADSNHYLSTWVAIQMSGVLTSLEKQIDHGEGIDSLMMQASYFGESLARVGADVRCLIVPIFAEHLLKKVNHDLAQAEIQFARNLQSFSLTSSALRPDTSSLDFPEPDDLNPPKQLVSHTPLALYLNEVLRLLNIVGKCALTQCAPSVVSKINSSVQKIGHQLETWGQNEWLTWELREQGEFNRMKRYFEHLVVPHLDKVARIIFPPVSIAEVTGLGVAKCAEIVAVKFIRAEG